MFAWAKNGYFTSNLWIGNPLGAFKDIQISPKSVRRTHRIKFSDPINSAWRTYSNQVITRKKGKSPLVSDNKS